MTSCDVQNVSNLRVHVIYFCLQLRLSTGNDWFSGGHAKLEFEIRCFYRRVFLDPCDSLQDKAFWLTRVLKPWPLVYQARLLFLLYGPVLGGELQLCYTGYLLYIKLSTSRRFIVKSFYFIGTKFCGLMMMDMFMDSWICWFSNQTHSY